MIEKIKNLGNLPLIIILIVVVILAIILSIIKAQTTKNTNADANTGTNINISDTTNENENKEDEEAIKAEIITKSMVKFSGLRANAPYYIKVKTVLTFVDGDFIYNIRSYISSFANIFSILLLYGATKEVSGIDNNKMFISVASMSVFATLVMDLVDKVLN